MCATHARLLRVLVCLVQRIFKLDKSTVGLCVIYLRIQVFPLNWLALSSHFFIWKAPLTVATEEMSLNTPFTLTVDFWLGWCIMLVSRAVYFKTGTCQIYQNIILKHICMFRGAKGAEFLYYGWRRSSYNDRGRMSLRISPLPFVMEGVLSLF